LQGVILAGGLGTRLSEETATMPKPMVEIGGKPIIWHIMKILGQHDISEFIICCGYKGYLIKEYFDNYHRHVDDFTIKLQSGEKTTIKKSTENWNITLIDTGPETQTGGRLKRVKDHIKGTFLMTYGDGVSDIDVTALKKFHYDSDRQATVTAVQPPGRFGALQLEKNTVRSFMEKPAGDSSWINGGFFILEPETINLISDDNTAWEDYPLRQLAKISQLGAYKHHGFWRPMDTLRDKTVLEEMWEKNEAPWRTWET
jgi:glucose-1-phosphate cytidylyltransferase